MKGNFSINALNNSYNYYIIISNFSDVRTMVFFDMETDVSPNTARIENREVLGQLDMTGWFNDQHQHIALKTGVNSNSHILMP